MPIFAQNQPLNTVTMEKEVKYYGEWQEGSVILEKLTGPIGNGRVEFPNGDSFEGLFHLSFACISGPCYAACGKYTFADGSYIEHAWINTSEDLSKFGLKGVYEVKNADGSARSITSFYINKHGIELLASDPAEAIEWHNGKEVQRYGVNGYSLERVDEDRCILNVSLSNDVSVKMTGGRLNKNKYDRYYFETHLEGRIYYPDGSSYSSINYNICNLKPYDGWGTTHYANGKCRSEKYEGYNLNYAYEEKWDETAMVKKELPNPIHPYDCCQAETWSTYIRYSKGGEYSGDTVDGLPHGKGVLTFYDGRRYEGEFANGRCNGVVVYSVEGSDIHEERVWENGKIKDGQCNITLRYEWKSVEWSIGGKSDKTTREGTFTPRLGESIDIEGFRYIKVYEIKEDELLIGSCPLHRGESISFENEVEDDEASDGTVWSGTDYYIQIFWD